MDDILEYLDDLTRPDTMPPAYYELLKAVEPLSEKVRNAFSLKFLDQYTYAQSSLCDFECREAFSRGFRLGAQLILALAAPSAPDTHHKS